MQNVENMHNFLEDFMGDAAKKINKTCFSNRNIGTPMSGPTIKAKIQRSSLEVKKKDFTGG